MPGNTKEKEKCLEKLNQMQKYLPFLDFMIDKIKKKNSEISLECQLSKFQLLRSMIAEKNGKCTWDVVVKVEDVIQKLITKLDFKEPYEKPKQPLAATDIQASKNSTVSIVPFSTAAVSVTTSATVDSKPQDTSTNAVNLTMKTLKVPVDSKNTRDRQLLSNPYESAQPVDVSGKSLETDLDKDLDGFDLTECPALSGPESKLGESIHAAPEKPSTHDDLLSSSREKLLRSLQSRLFPSGIPNSSTSPGICKNEKALESQNSAFSHNQINVNENKSKSDVFESSEPSAVDKNNKKEIPLKMTEKKGFVVSKSLISGSSSDKYRTDSSYTSSDVNIKQKLKEKLSTVIGKVYRVPGKSVGGSLRSLKESKDQKKSIFSEEEALFKPEKPQHSRPSTERKDNQGDKSLRDATLKERKGDQSSLKHGSSSSGIKCDDKSSKDSKKYSRDCKKHLELSKVNDEELLGILKENMQSFPHLAKMKLPELKQVVQSSIAYNLAGVDTDGISEISDDSFQDLDDVAEDKRTKADVGESKEIMKDTKLKGASDTSIDENLNDEDYALKLIEDTTPKTYPPKKKKGLLELPMPIIDDLFDDISSIESFESFRSPSENKDPRLGKTTENKKLCESKLELKDEVAKSKEVSTSIQVSPQPPKDTSHSSKPPAEKKIQEKPFKQNQVIVENINLSHQNICPKPSPSNRDPRRRAQSSTQAKSYAEYKRRKLREQKEAQRESFKSSDGSNVSDASLPSAEKEEIGANSIQGPQRRDSSSKSRNPIVPNPIRTYENRKSNSKIKYKSQDNSKERKNSQEDMKKGDDKAKKSTEQEELVSPLEELYRNERKPKTGLGYGLQNFKIPKKVFLGPQSKKKQSSGAIEEAEKSEISSKGTKEVKEGEKEKEKISQVPVVKSVKAAESKTNDFTQVDSTVSCKNDPKVDLSKSSTKTDANVSEVEPGNSSVVDSSESAANAKVKIAADSGPESLDLAADTSTNLEVSEVKTDVQNSPNTVNDAEEQVVSTKESKAVEETTKKVEPEIVECDSSMETASLNEQTSEKDAASSGDKSTALQKEEITQEFVEALIRKSFQSGEGKLLLAQVKLFEKFARKLNSKKLKTIQKIINSESDSSSSPPESSSDDEKKKKKGKKSEERSRSKKRRKKRKSRKKKKWSSSSSTSSSYSSSENEESSEEESCDKKEDDSESKKKEDSATTADCEGSKTVETSTASEEAKPKSNELPGASKTKSKKRRRNLVFGRNFCGKKAKRRLKQKKMLEKILKEGPQPEASNDSNTEYTSEAPTKERKKTKAKVKTELDRLHDDIRSMFISEGVVTATGQRMCRILKQSGGNMNNLDIVKESARMVEEEKLNNGSTRTSLRNSRATNTGSTENRSRSQSLDKVKSQQENEEQNPKLKLEPCVVLQRVNLDNFGFGIKISDDCISFRRLVGGNTAIKRTKMSSSEGTTKSPFDAGKSRNVFLARNKRKFLRLRDSGKKKSFRGKKLTEVVKNLPLKMAKMKHLQICGKKEDEALKSGTEDTDACRSKLSEWELKRYAFDKKQELYPCKLCTTVTSNITGHYKTIHPESEVLISRLNKQEATKAKLEAEKFRYDEEEDEQRSPKTLLGRGVSYYCRMCRSSKITDIDTFASHVSTHTGETRYKCPSDGCSIYRSSYGDIKFHILTKHPRYRNELNSKITELYELTVVGNNIFGFLCSKCNFVQICRKNLENHISNQHKDSKDAFVIKINMSGRKVGPVKKRKTDVQADTTETKKKSDCEVEKPPPTTITEENDETGVHNKRKRISESEIETESKVEPPEKKTFVETPAVVEAEKKSGKGKQEVLDKEDINLEESEMHSELKMEDCVDLKTISELKGSDIIKSIENPKGRYSGVKTKEKETEFCNELKVGPLKAQLLENSGVLYECFVKGCLFSTRVYDLFQKHIKISHWKIKWNGFCGICSKEKDIIKVSYRLLYALKHLKLHEREKFVRNKTVDDNEMELKRPISSEDLTVDDEDEKSGVKYKSSDEAEGGEMQDKPPETSYPSKPLLRVRNFLGDRLSTPKPDDSQVGTNDDGSNTPEPPTKMFTIENVRSLKPAPAEDSGLRIEQVCSLKNQTPQSGSEKKIIVRSCPSRTIPILPKLSALPVDVQPPSVSHPVVLGPISSNSSIQIISKAAISEFPAKPIVIPSEGVRLNSAIMPVIRSGLTPAKSATVIGNTEVKAVSYKTVEGTSGNKNSAEVERTPSPHKSPSGSSMLVHLGRNSSPEEDDTDREDDSQRIFFNSKSRNKSVKDAKIYLEMLTKSKLCHLFKCMGVECSFTCNNEQVFKQHIGLHEAQRRLGRSKSRKSIRLTNKSADTFHWQQCAYCWEILSSTNNALSQHILDEHGHCMYQCAFCFYRAISHSYVEIHQNLAHSVILKTTPRLIYKCKPLRVPPTQAIALEKHGRRQSVRPYHCDQCGKNFFITSDFTTHLATEHQSVTAYTCHICKNLCFKVNRLINHYKLHSYSTYQCAYCLHGTETEKEMVFHLSNFHFSQPPIMYVRALAEGQNEEEKQKPNRKKKSQSSQLDSLKVIVYDSDTSSADCVVDVDQEDDVTDNASPSDLSSIVAELGISTESGTTSSGVTPLIQELASIGDKTAKNLTVKTLLPNAQFSSENESGVENCSVLISSGLSIPSDQNDDKEMNIPLGQLPLEAVNVQHKEATPPDAPPTAASPPDRNLKLNEIIVNRYCKSLVSTEEEKIGQPTVILSSAVHKLPPVVLTRAASKNSYPSKRAAVRKKSEEQVQKENFEGDKELGTGDKTQQNVGNEKESVPSGKDSLAKESDLRSPKNPEPFIANVVSLSDSEFDSGKIPETSILSKTSSISNKPTEETKDNSQGVVINIKSKVTCPFVLKPPIIRVEDFPIDENGTPKPSAETPVEKPNENTDEEQKKKEDEGPPSPDVIILENQKAKDIVTVTIDSDEEKDESSKKEPKPIEKNVTIRKEMELLRKQITNETDLLLTDEPIERIPKEELTLNVQPNDKVEEPSEKSLLSPIEEAICSLNKKLQSETEVASRKEEDEKKDVEDSPKKTEECLDRPRTRFGARDRRREGAEGAEKSEDDSNYKKDDIAKGKRFKEELVGKALFICGNEKCNFAADDDVALKDHLYVCDLSRESSMLVCPHCSRQIKQFHPYLEHLRYHGVKKFHCGLCSFSSAVDTSAARHVKVKHKSSLVKILPKESKEGHLVYYPKNYKVEKLDFEVNGYSPGDEDKLPLQAVYQVNVKCAKCPYFTKVRSNMVRHLKIHVKSAETEGVVVVPSTAPTNPVPCLETKERMFDKMTNLAASSQLAQAKEKTSFESLSPEEEAKLPQFVTEQMRYKCCLPDCNYITVDGGMLRHHIKALHAEINHYSCPHCQDTVHADVRHVTLDKIGHHLKHHDSKLYKCAHCIYFHYQKNVVEKHTMEKHPDKRYYVHTVREPKSDIQLEEESSSGSDGGARVWKCSLCDEFRTPSKPTLLDHIWKTHNTKSAFKCQFCQMKGNNHQSFVSHFSSKHPGEKVSYLKVYSCEKVPCADSPSGNSSGADSSNDYFDTTPLWQRGAPRIRHIRGILIEEEEMKTKKSKRASLDESEAETSVAVKVKENAFYCPLCTNKKKPFYTRSEDCFRTHLYQELNYQQFACILCGKMFADKKDFEKHHSRVHSDKPHALKQTKEDHEIKFWVDQVIAKRKKQMEERKRKLSDEETSEGQGPPKKKK